MADNEVPKANEQKVIPKKTALQTKLEKDGPKYGLIGVIGTAAYLALVAWILTYNSVDLGSMEPNAWGDFLAGIFGPLALFWVVMGFWQQGSELKNSRDALMLQAEELRNSVEAQKGLVEATVDQTNAQREFAEAERRNEVKKAQPSFRLMGDGSLSNGTVSRLHKFNLMNVGAKSIDVLVSSRSEDGEEKVANTPVIDQSAVLAFALDLPRVQKDHKRLITVYYSDVFGNQQTHYFTLNVENNRVLVDDDYGDPGLPPWAEP